MESPQITIIVPVYNVEQSLSRCIDSILAQTFIDFELLLIFKNPFTSHLTKPKKTSIINK